MAMNAWWDGDPTETYWMEITDRDDLGGELWAPKHNAVGRDEWSYDLVSFVQPGDRVFHWRKEDRAIVGWSEAAGPLGSDTRSWQARGTAGRTRGVPTSGPTWVMPLKGLHLLDNPVSRAELNSSLYADVVSVLDATEEAVGEPSYAPFQHYGGRELRAQQGYLTKFPAALVTLLFPTEAEVGESAAEPHGSASPRKGRGQAYMTDAPRRAAIERHAVDAAKDYYLALGATEIVELGKPYDLRVTIGNIERHVEVKGSTISNIETVQLTHGEVKHARGWEATDLVIVDGIRLWADADGGIRTDGGTLRSWLDWSPADRHLQPTHLRYSLPR